MVMGAGGSPETIIIAAAMRCVGGGVQARLWPRDDAERARLTVAGFDPVTGVVTGPGGTVAMPNVALLGVRLTSH